MGKIFDEFGKIISDLQGSISGTKTPLRLGRIARGAVYEGRDYSIGYGEKPGASLMLTLDKKDFADAIGRVEAYKHIPYYTGGDVMWKVSTFLVDGTGGGGEEGPIKRAFREQSAPSGKKWDDITDATRAWRRYTSKESGGDPEGPILDFTGNLKSLATSHSKMISAVVTGKYARVVIGPENLSGDERFKFYTHQLGSKFGWGTGFRTDKLEDVKAGINIPARPFFPTSTGDLTKEEMDVITKLIKKGIKEGVEEHKAQIASRKRE